MTILVRRTVTRGGVCVCEGGVPWASGGGARVEEGHWPVGCVYVRGAYGEPQGVGRKLKRAPGRWGVCVWGGRTVSPRGWGGSWSGPLAGGGCVCVRGAYREPQGVGRELKRAPGRWGLCVCEGGVPWAPGGGAGVEAGPRPVGGVCVCEGGVPWASGSGAGVEAGPWPVGCVCVRGAYREPQGVGRELKRAPGQWGVCVCEGGVPWAPGGGAGVEAVPSPVGCVCVRGAYREPQGVGRELKRAPGQWGVCMWGGRTVSLRGWGGSWSGPWPVGCVCVSGAYREPQGVGRELKRAPGQWGVCVCEGGVPWAPGGGAGVEVVPWPVGCVCVRGAYREPQGVGRELKRAPGRRGIVMCRSSFSQR